MHQRTTFGGGSGSGFGLTGDYPRDVVALIGVLFGTNVLAMLTDGQLLQWLMLNSNVWHKAWVWQLATHTFVGNHPPGIFFLIEFLILFMFGRTAYYDLGRHFFWRLLLVAGAGGGAIATLTYGLGSLLGAQQQSAFSLFSGQYTVGMILITAFAVIHRGSTIRFMMVIPMEARLFLYLELAMLVVGFAVTKDLPGFLGLLGTMGITFTALQPSGIRRQARELWLRLQTNYLRWKVDRMRAKRGFRVVGEDEKTPGDDDRDRWVN